MKNYYKILGLNLNATKKEISHAYKILAKKYHLDINKEESVAEKFKEISESYRTLNNPLSKKNYDEKLKNYILKTYSSNTTNNAYQTNYNNINKENIYAIYTNTNYTSNNNFYYKSDLKNSMKNVKNKKSNFYLSNIKFFKVIKKLFLIPFSIIKFSFLVFKKFLNRISKRLK